MTLITTTTPMRDEAFAAARLDPAGSTSFDLVVLPSADSAYAALATSHPQRSLFTSPPWIRALEAGYGFTVEVLGCSIAGGLAAAIPFVRLDDMRGQRLAALPFSDYADPLVEDPAMAASLIGRLAEEGLPLRLRTLRNPLPAADPRLEMQSEALWHGVDLARPHGAIWAGLAGSARQNIRKAERGGVSVRIGHGLEDIRLFHRMHGHLRKTKYRMLAQPEAFFTALYEAFAPVGGIGVAIAEADGEPLAAILMLEWQDTLYYKFNASFDTQLRPNDLLAWHAIRHAMERGLAHFDFGLSDADQPGLVRYKRKFATEERAIRQLALPARRPPSAAAEAAGQTLGQVTELFTRDDVPEAITREAGDALYRYFA